MKTFHLTDPGEGLTEAEIVGWQVEVGDTVALNDIVVEVETSKSVVELPIPYAGTVVEILVETGRTVDVGTPLIVIDDGSGASDDAGDGSGAADGSSGRTPNLVGYGPTESSTTRRKRTPHPQRPDPSAEAAHDQLSETFDTDHKVARKADERNPLPNEPVTATGEPLPSPGEPDQVHPAVVEPTKVLAKPPVRKLAKDLGIDLHQVEGSGPGGIVTRGDVEKAARTPEPTPAAAPVGTALRSAGLSDRRVPIKGVRKAVAEAMVSSASVPQASEWVTCDVTATMELLDRLAGQREFREVKLSPLLMVARAVCLAMGRNPELNTSWDEAAQEIAYHGQVNLGIAAATERGLLVPNIKAADRLSLRELADALTELTSVAKQGRTQPADMAGGTFTITNIGVFGIDAGTPLLNPGEAAILAVGAIDRRPWVVGEGAEERIEPRWVTTLALTIDHRLVDGEQASRFLADVARILRDPAMALAM